MRKATSSSSSSISSSNYPVNSTASSLSQLKAELCTDLRLGLSLSTSQNADPSVLRGQPSDWPPIQPQLKESLVAEESECGDHASFFVKVYMEGIPIGRKLDLLAHNDYNDLIRTLDHMFDTNILWGNDMDGVQLEKCHVLTYEDEEGDLMMVGDVPWEMFLSTVKRLKITKVETC
ncbi:Auxin-responsive protein [Quillaja saponaria]|uniref:Auxin-induced protein n=1 Tax=Quillaja saponaria TaxID=32244 RepID=A0AAD7VJ67_QUISA|nr:Auxin-responsive protein [Quillaja saponaria]